MSAAIERAAIKALAEKITRELFTDGLGDEADRLVLMDEKGKERGGLGYEVVLRKVERQLRGKS